MPAPLIIPILLASLVASTPASKEYLDQPGRVEFFFSNRTFESPVFGSRSTGTYRFYARQRLPGLGDMSFWLADGFPNFTKDFGTEWDGIPFAGGEARLNAGDFFLQPLRPRSVAAVTRETYPLRGVALSFGDGQTRWTAFAGQAKHFRQLPGRESEAPTLVGSSVLRRRGFDHYGLSVTSVRGASFLENSGVSGNLATVLTGEYMHEFSPSHSFFAQLLATDHGSFGGRGGLNWQSETASLRTTLYSFGDEFPFVDPLYRPGEKGVEFSGYYSLSQSTTFSGFLDYVADGGADQHSEMRGQAAIGWFPGDRFPNLHLSYSRNETIFDSLTVAEPGTTVDRLALSLLKSSSSGVYAVSAEHLSNSRDDSPDRNQLAVDFRRILGTKETFLDGSFLVQQLAGANLGFTAETAIERPLSPLLSYRIGGGLALVDRLAGLTGEGAIRVGLARRLRRQGWSLRVEGILPFSLGIPSSNLSRAGAVVSLGYILGWKDFRDLRNRLPRGLGRLPQGGVEGIVRFEGGTESGVIILVNGQPAARSRDDGTFRITGLPPGPAVISLDLRGVDPRWSLVGDAGHTVEIQAGEIARVEFVLRPFSYFQGALVRWEGDQMLPLVAVRLRLEGPGLSLSTDTTRLGGFQFSQVPPGVYSLNLDLHTLPSALDITEPLSWVIDLQQDQAGYLVCLNCPEE